MDGGGGGRREEVLEAAEPGARDEGNVSHTGLHTPALEGWREGGGEKEGCWTHPEQHVEHEDDSNFQWVNVNENAYGTFIYIGMVQVCKSAACVRQSEERGGGRAFLQKDCCREVH